ncbi:MAG TPA: DNA repair protein RecN [Cytophagales bacterium]|nr:DNA repair protein RecN [Cytophagales bacterium]HAA19108.1 DNA repair protein RecN [Cytophagales bacterium]HAP62733.1 DNA repair protein RecN [Cytophagales bacterium]
MLTHLSIKNYALIEQLELEPSAQFNTITGETGAGKSIMLGAIGLLLGNRADTKSLYDESNKCVIEGTFEIEAYGLEALFEEEELDYEAKTVIRREITPAGKSRAFVNDTPVRLEGLRELGAALMDIHSQHDTLALGEHGFQLMLVDAYAANEELKATYRIAYQDFKKAQKALEQLQSEAAEIRKEADYHQFLFSELDQAQFQAEEQTELEAELKVLENAEEIKNGLQQSINFLEEPDQGISSLLHNALAAMKPLQNMGTVYNELHQRLDSVAIELRDWVKEAESADLEVELDPERLTLVQDRLSLIYKLQQKHGVDSVAGLLAIYTDLEAKVAKVTNLDDDLAKAAEEAELAEADMRKHAATLTESRTRVFSAICRELEVLLSGLGMPDALMSIENREVSPGPNGIDEISVLFSANKGIATQELKQVASGGEFSRLMFAIKYVLADKMALPTMIFDEIDTGVSGEIAKKMGSMMQAMAKGHQVITISHLPQVAAKGDAHFFVYKDTSAARTVSRIKMLEGWDRMQAIAQMIDGDNPSASALESAKELLEQA